MRTACARPAGCVLDDVGDAHAEARAVAGGGADLVSGLRGDDDPDVLDPGRGDRLDAVEEDRLVGDRHELLGAGVGDRPQAGAPAAREDQALHHGELAMVPTGARLLDEADRRRAWAPGG